MVSVCLVFASPGHAAAGLCLQFIGCCPLIVGSGDYRSSGKLLGGRGRVDTAVQLMLIPGCEEDRLVEFGLYMYASISTQLGTSRETSHKMPKRRRTYKLSVQDKKKMPLRRHEGRDPRRTSVDSFLIPKVAFVTRCRLLPVSL